MAEITCFFFFFSLPFLEHYTSSEEGTHIADTKDGWVKKKKRKKYLLLFLTCIASVVIFHSIFFFYFFFFPFLKLWRKKRSVDIYFQQRHQELLTSTMFFVSFDFSPIFFNITIYCNKTLLMQMIFKPLSNMKPDQNL